MRFFLLTLILASSVSFAANLQDVIYKKDGSVLRGNLIEQDFTNGTYKIQLAGGSVFNINKDEIEKITKEAPFDSVADSQSGININVENNPSINQAPVVTQAPQVTQTALQQTYNYAPKEKRTYKHVYSIGNHGKTMRNEYDNGVSYDGFSLAYQYNFNSNVALYAEHGRAKLDDIIINNNRYDVDTENNDKYRSTRIAALLSTNTYEGWQFYTGLGVFDESFSSDTGGLNLTATGTTIIFGLGYSWKNLQTQLRVGIDESSDYDIDYGPSYSGTTVGIQLGLNI